MPRLGAAGAAAPGRAERGVDRRGALRARSLVSRDPRRRNAGGVPVVAESSGYEFDTEKTFKILGVRSFLTKRNVEVINLDEHDFEFLKKEHQIYYNKTNKAIKLTGLRPAAYRHVTDTSNVS